MVYLYPLSKGGGGREGWQAMVSQNDEKHVDHDKGTLEQMQDHRKYIS
jgi:hypothetical protein